MIEIFADPKKFDDFLVSSKTKKIVFADLQIHSKYARATSKDISIENLEKYARIKGLDLLGVGDFQHPIWRKEIDEKLQEDDKGILRTSTGFKFLWQTEVSLMFSQEGKRRAVHLLIFAPNRNIADKIISYLGSKGRLDYDGRPIFGISCKDLVKDLKEIEDKIEIIPAHCMTPYFGLFGSQSGFDSLKECFQDQVDKIYAIESGMSADPEMLWKLNENVNIVSFSDAHSFWPWRLGREATIFELEELSYDNIIKAIRTGRGLKATIETPPEYGKYHFDGHRDCNFSCSPKETEKLNKICPVCNKQLILGVDYRIEKIKKETSLELEKRKPYYSLLPLHELISLAIGNAMASKSSWKIYNELIEKFGNEFNILLRTEKEKLAQIIKNNLLLELIIKNGQGKIKVRPGYDGVYGIPLIEKHEEQGRLF
ncbi:MAG: endonuclease Q family protein [Nanoarchaeota archaeon]